MPWAFVRPQEPDVLGGRPLLDIGTGDGQTLLALTEPIGLVVGVERSFDVLRTARLSRAVCADAAALPIANARIATVLAADLFHHFDDDRLGVVLEQVRGVLHEGGRLVAWWYQAETRGGPGAPRFPRTYREVAEAVLRVGFAGAEALELVTAEAGPPTVGIDAKV